jgi:hypothetical protein
VGRLDRGNDQVLPRSKGDALTLERTAKLFDIIRRKPQADPIQCHLEVHIIREVAHRCTSSESLERFVGLPLAASTGRSFDRHVGFLHDLAHTLQFGSKFLGMRFAAALVGRKQVGAEFRQASLDRRIR